MKIKITRTYEFNEEEKETILKALKYVKHRITKHPECGAKTMNLKNIEDLVRFLDLERVDNLVKNQDFVFGLSEIIDRTNKNSRA